MRTRAILAKGGALNDNAPPPARQIPIIGEVRDDGRVVINDQTWRPAPRPAPQLAVPADRD